MASTYKDDLKDKQAQLKLKCRKWDSLNKWIEDNSTLNPDWDNKLNEVRQLGNEIEVLRENIHYLKTKTNAVKRQTENINY